MYEIGKLYQLEDIKSLVPRLAGVVSKPSAFGMVHLFKDRETSVYWLGGPLKGRDTNFFLYLGAQTSSAESLEKVKHLLAIAIREPGAAASNVIESRLGSGMLNDRDYDLFDLGFDLDDIWNSGF